MARILHVSDVHCANANLSRVLAREDYDLVLATGDYECVDTAWTLLREARAPVLAVTGNMDDPSVARVLRSEGVLIDGRTTEALGLLVAGVGGLDPSSSIESLRRKVSGARVEILLSHHPPRGVLDRTFIGIRIGLREIERLVSELSPGLHLFGHVHESRGTVRRDGTLFVNPGPLKRGYYAVITGGPGRWSAELREL